MVVQGEHKPKLSYVVAFVIGLALMAGLTILWSVERNFAYWFIGVSALTIMALRLSGKSIVKIAKKYPGPKAQLPEW